MTAAPWVRDGFSGAGERPWTFLMISFNLCENLLEKRTHYWAAPQLWKENPPMCSLQPFPCLPGEACEPPSVRRLSATSALPACLVPLTPHFRCAADRVPRRWVRSRGCGISQTVTCMVTADMLTVSTRRSSPFRLHGVQAIR